jgi:hypothetical protein
MINISWYSVSTPPPFAPEEGDDSDVGNDAAGDGEALHL